MKAKVKTYGSKAGYGFIKAEDGKEYFFHRNQIPSDYSNPRMNDEVEFEKFEYDGKTQARITKVISKGTGSNDHRDNPGGKLKPGQTPDYSGPAINLSAEVLKDTLIDIAEWKLEAKLEDVQKYFLAFPEVGQIQSGNISYVIGRKGTGKTAIVSHFTELKDPNYSFEKLSFKNFPFNELYALENSNFTRPNQYISLWTYIIYSTIVRMMAESESIDPLLRKKILKIYPEHDASNLKGLLHKWTAGDFSVSVLGSGISFSNWFKSKKDTTWIERVEHLKDFIVHNCDSRAYVVMFDELDEDYKDMISQQVTGGYIQLLTSLFKAVQEIRSVMGRAGKKIFPVVFLRDDIYDIITDADKNKWRDFTTYLEWSTGDIKLLLKHRIEKASGVSGGNFEEIWHSVFTHQSIPYSAGNKSTGSFEYISRSTQGRPRDYIFYLQECAKNQLSVETRLIDKQIIIDADKSYSNYLKSELVDEIHGIIPDINNVFRIFTHIRKWILSIDEFREVFHDYYEKGIIQTRDPDFVLQSLFYFSVVGNVARNGVHIFRHERPESVLNFHEKIVMHRGLMKALQIL